MFGLRKPKPQKATFSGWLEEDIRFLASCFSKDDALLECEISGIRHSTRFCGEAFSSAVRISRSDHDFYRKYALAFDDPPIGEDSHLLAVHQHELVGFTSHPPARIRCHFGIGKLEEIEEGNLGWLCLMRGADNDLPMIKVHFNVQTVEQEIDLRRTMQAALSGRGKAFINFILYPIKDSGEWVARLMRDGVSTSVNIKAVYASTIVGRDPHE